MLHSDDDGGDGDRADLGSVFIAWKENHWELFRAQLDLYPGAHYFPLNQKAADPALLRGEILNLPPFWNLLPDPDFTAIDRVADEFAARWHDGPHRHEAVRAWIWAREAEWTKRLLLTLESWMHGIPRYLVPWSSPQAGDGWHGAALAPQVVLEEWRHAGRVEIIRVPESDDAPESLAPVLGRVVDHLAPPGHDWIFFSGFGVPDLIFHLQTVLRRDRGSVLLWPDPNESGPLVLIREYVKARGSRLQLLNFSARMLGDENVSAPAGTGILGQWLCASAENLNQQTSRLAVLFSASPPRFCVTSDHDAARTRMVFELCEQQGVPIVVLPHSSWPMADPFFAKPNAGQWNCTYLAATRRAVKHLAPRVGTAARVTTLPLPSPRYRVSLRRGARALWRWLSPGNRPVRVGVAVTSGEAVVASDMAIIAIAAGLNRLLQTPDDLAAHVRFQVRLRETEDRASVLCRIAGIPMDRLTWEKAGSRTPVHFLRDMDIVIEIGTPGSIMLECFAQGIPFLRGGSMPHRRRDFMLPRSLVPWLSPVDPWVELAPLIRSPWRRNMLAMRQFAFLLRDVGWPTARLEPSVQHQAEEIGG